jgi:hypothetical protein
VGKAALRAPSTGTVLFVFESLASFRLQRILIDFAVRQGRDVTLLFTGKAAAFPALEQEASRIGARAYAFGDLVGQIDGSVAAGAPSGGVRSLAARLSASASGKTPKLEVFRKSYGRRLAVAHKLLAEIEPSALICSEDGLSSDFAILTAARRANIPVVNVPFGFGSVYEIERDLARKEGRGELIRPSIRERALLEIVSPQWIKRGNFSGCLMYPPELIWAWESLGITLRDPWIVHGGLSDVLCVESDACLAQYVREKIPPRKLCNSGSPYCDYMFSALSNDALSAEAFRTPKKMESGVTRILVSWPPSYHQAYPGTNEFPTYEEMTRATFSMLAGLPRVKLTVSLHPACSPEIASFISGLGIKITQDYIVGLLPASDVFVTYFSSTIRWALAAGKVVVNYDAYRLGLRTFDSAPGFLNSETFADLSGKLQAIASSDRAFSDVAEAQAKVAEHWGRVDGECNARIFDAVDRAVSAAGAKRPARRS